MTFDSPMTFRSLGHYAGVTRGYANPKRRPQMVSTYLLEDTQVQAGGTAKGTASIPPLSGDPHYSDSM